MTSKESNSSRGNDGVASAGTSGKALPNIDDLFVNHSLSEIKMIERKFHHDIDRKREDLRLVVGERYKDVIDVSDKLMGITQHSTKIKERLRNIESLCEKFQKQNQIGNFVKEEEKLSERKRRGGGEVSAEVVIGCQLKLLSVIPEKILIFLDKGQYVRASQLVHLAQIIKDCLIGPLSENRHAIKSKFSIINRISVQQMRTNIKQSLVKELIDLDRHVKDNESLQEKGVNVSSTPLGKAASVFAEVVEAFCVLDNMSFLEACLHCMNVLSDHLKQFLEDDKSTRSVSEVLTLVTKSMLVLFNCVHLLIYGHPRETTARKYSSLDVPSSNSSDLKDYSNKGSQSEISDKDSLFDVLYPQQSQLKRCLPSTITEFTLPQVQLWPQNIDEFERSVSTCLQQSFIEKLKHLVEEQLKYVKNVKALTNMKAQLVEMVCEFGELRNAEIKRLEVQLKTANFEFDPWKQLFETPFLCSIKCIVKESAISQWNEIDAALTNHLIPLFDNEMKPKSSSNKNGHSSSASANETVVANVNLDKATYLWNQSVSIDTAKSSASSVNNKTTDGASSNESSSPSHLGQLMSHKKMRTETPVIISIGQNLDDIVDCLCEKTKEYFMKTQVVRNKGSSSGVFVEKGPNDMFNNISGDASRSQANDYSDGAVSDINVDISAILISKLISFLQNQNHDTFNGSLLKLEVQIRLLDYISSNCNCVQQLKKNQEKEVALESLGRLRNLTDTLQKSWVEKLTEEATVELLPRASPVERREVESDEEKSSNCCLYTKEQLVSRFMAACWEQVDITEETEDGQPVTTKLPIPIKASHPVHQVLYFVTSALNRILPPTANEGDSKKSAIGKSKLDSQKTPVGAPSGHLLCELLRESLLMKLSQYYENDLYQWVKSHQDLSKNSKLMIQFVYDIKFVSAILKAPDSVSFTDSSIIMNESFAALSTPSGLADLSNILGLFEEFIDPFDYDVYSSHLSQKLMQELNQSQHLYGFIMGSSSIAKASAVSTLGNNSSKSASHNLCDLVAAPLKFQPLSVPANASFGLKRNLGSAVVNKPPSSISSPLSVEKQQASSSGSLLKNWLSNK